jgi:hypothetical protein
MVKRQLFLQHTTMYHPLWMDGGDLDMYDDDIYVEDDGTSPSNDIEFGDTDGDDDRQSGRSTNTHISGNPDTDGEVDSQIDE